MTDTPSQAANTLDILRGGAHLDVTFADASVARVFVREVTVAEILEGKYVELLRTDYPGLLEHICELDPPAEPGWPARLTRESWTALREQESRLNFEFALAETTAAWERGQRLKFVDEQIMEQSERLLKTMGSLTSSASTAGSRAPARKKPVAAPSAGSRR